MESSNNKKSLEQLKNALSKTKNPQIKKGLEHKISMIENNKTIKK
jgi:hypothetical protein